MGNKYWDFKIKMWVTEKKVLGFLLIKKCQVLNSLHTKTITKYKISFI
jgi:hypothetical protein